MSWVAEVPVVPFLGRKENDLMESFGWELQIAAPMLWEAKAGPFHWCGNRGLKRHEGKRESL